MITTNDYGVIYGASGGPKFSSNWCFLEVIEKQDHEISCTLSNTLFTHLSPPPIVDTPLLGYNRGRDKRFYHHLLRVGAVILISMGDILLMAIH